MTYDIIIRAVSDTQDPGILLTAEIALAMASVSAGISMMLLVDWFKRRGWVYKHKKKEKDKELKEYLKKEKDSDHDYS